MIFILYRTAENNQRQLSHGFKNISFRDNMYVDQSRPLSVFLVKAELRKFGEVRSHPPHPPWLRHWHQKLPSLQTFKNAHTSITSLGNLQSEMLKLSQRRLKHIPMQKGYISFTAKGHYISRSWSGHVSNTISKTPYCPLWHSDTLTCTLCGPGQCHLRKITSIQTVWS